MNFNFKAAIKPEDKDLYFFKFRNIKKKKEEKPDVRHVIFKDEKWRPDTECLFCVHIPL